MNNELLNTIIPPLIFFILFFVAFSLLELLIVFFLNRLERRNWEFMIDVVIRYTVHHKKAIRYGLLTAAFVLIAIVLLFTPLLEVLAAATPELRFFAVVMAFMMVLMYFINSRKNTRVAIEQKIYRTIFFFLSIIFYALILVVANSSYGRYQNFINTTFVDPTVQKVGQAMEDQEKERLLTLFTEQYVNGECDDVDYTEQESQGLLNLVYIDTSPGLSFESEIDFNHPKFFLRGKECTDGENTFLLNANGNWYWVIAN